VVEIDSLSELLVDRERPTCTPNPGSRMIIVRGCEVPLPPDVVASLSPTSIRRGGVVTVLQTLYIKVDSDETDYTRLKSAVHHMARLHRLTSLSIEIAPRDNDQSDEDNAPSPYYPFYIGVHDAEASYLVGLGNLWSLRSLTIIDGRHRLTDSLLRRWCEDGRFSELRELSLNCYVNEIDSCSDDEMDSQDEAESVAAPILSSDGVAHLLRLPQLYRLTIDSLSDDLASAMITRVNHANACGRSPTLEFILRGHTIHRHFTRLEQLVADGE
jgi:hypothetical protein